MNTIPKEFTLNNSGCRSFIPLQFHPVPLALVDRQGHYILRYVNVCSLKFLSEPVGGSGDTHPLTALQDHKKRKRYLKYVHPTSLNLSHVTAERRDTTVLVVLAHASQNPLEPVPTGVTKRR